MKNTLHAASFPALLACLLLVAGCCGSPCDVDPCAPDPCAPTAAPAPDLDKVGLMPTVVPTWTHQIGPGGATWYVTGPQQAMPPNGMFAAGTKVRVVSAHGSYVQVETEGGVTGYVAADSVVRIP